MFNQRRSNGYLALAFALPFALVLAWAGLTWAADDTLYKTADGIAVYVGVVPAEIVKGPAPPAGERPMHGGIPTGRLEYHIVAALFDANSGVRVEDATVKAQVSGLGLAGPSKTLERMEIAGTSTYGGFFNFPGRDLYTIELTITRPGVEHPAILDFHYDHRR